MRHIVLGIALGGIGGFFISISIDWFFNIKNVLIPFLGTSIGAFAGGVLAA